MKLLLAMIRDEDMETVSHELVVSGFRVTRIASTGGFLRRGNTTFMIGVEDEKVEQVIQIMKTYCTQPSEPNQGRATVFVLNVAKYDHF
jgi:uncharacterized protein YaaQ